MKGLVDLKTPEYWNGGYFLRMADNNEFKEIKSIDTSQDGQDGEYTDD